MEILATNANLAGVFISTASLSLDPQLNAKWLVGMAMVSQTAQLNASVPVPFLASSMR